MAQWVPLPRAEFSQPQKKPSIYHFRFFQRRRSRSSPFPVHTPPPWPSHRRPDAFISSSSYNLTFDGSSNPYRIAAASAPTPLRQTRPHILPPHGGQRRSVSQIQLVPTSIIDFGLGLAIG